MKRMAVAPAHATTTPPQHEGHLSFLGSSTANDASLIPDKKYAAPKQQLSFTAFPIRQRLYCCGVRGKLSVNPCIDVEFTGEQRFDLSQVAPFARTAITTRCCRVYPG